FGGLRGEGRVLIHGGSGGAGDGRRGHGLRGAAVRVRGHRDAVGAAAAHGRAAWLRERVAVRAGGAEVPGGDHDRVAPLQGRLVAQVVLHVGRVRLARPSVVPGGAA